MGSANYKLAIKPDTSKIRKLIENGLLTDWVVKVEYESAESDSACWQQWDKTLFALRSAEPVLVALTDCYIKNPDRAIRLNAEKVHPRTRMLYMVYNPKFLPADVRVKPRITSLPYLSKEDTASTQVGLRMQDS